MTPVRTLLSWSSGKDSAWTLQVLRQRHAREVEVVGLLTTVGEEQGRVTSHGVREELVEAQARAIGLPLWRVPLPEPCSNARYEAALGAELTRAREQGITAIAFGDLFLADIRAYRETQLAASGIRPLFPLWAQPTDTLAHEMIAGGLRARVICIDPRHLPRSFAGREFDAALLADLPAGVDPCGERGEFHTFAYDGPMFGEPVRARAGESVERDGFVFADPLPG